MSLGTAAVLIAVASSFTACGSSEDPPQKVAQVRASTDFPVGDAGPRDSEEAASYPLPAGQTGTTDAPAPSSVKPAKAKAASSATGSASSVSPGAPSDAEIRKELQQMNEAMKAQSSSAPAAGSLATVEADGLAQVPPNAPLAVERIVAGGNAIAHFPYVYGGGHASFVDSAYDCSASLSYALAAAGLLSQTMTSGELAHWGAAGPGKWVTIYANETHTFMYVAGLRFDTSGRDGPLGSRWQTAPRSLAGFAVRHPIGL